MSSLLEQLRPQYRESEFDKTAEQIFEAAVIDELEKMGYDVEILKQANVVGRMYGAAKNAFGIGRKVVNTPAQFKDLVVTGSGKAVPRAQFASATAKKVIRTPKSFDTALAATEQVDRAARRSL